MNPGGDARRHEPGQTSAAPARPSGDLFDHLPGKKKAGRQFIFPPAAETGIFIPETGRMQADAGFHCP
jgi:hypothetical protein